MHQRDASRGGRPRVLDRLQLLDGGLHHLDQPAGDRRAAARSVRRASRRARPTRRRSRQRPWQATERCRLALDSTSGDASVWGSKEFAEAPPQLIVDVAKGSGGELDGLTRVADAATGSKESTAFAGNRHLARTAGGRLLAVHGRYASGVQLAWRNPGGAWQRSTQGAVSDGRLLSGVSRRLPRLDRRRERRRRRGARLGCLGRHQHERRQADPDGAPGRPRFARRPEGGPDHVGGRARRGAYRPDVAFERGADGVLRGVLIWSRKQHRHRVPGGHGLVQRSGLTHASDPRLDRARANHLQLFEVGRTRERAGRHAGGRPRLGQRDARVAPRFAAPRTTWSGSGAGTAPCPAAHRRGWCSTTARFSELWTARSTWSRCSASPAPARHRRSSCPCPGYRQPTLATDGTNVWLVAVRASDGFVISRQFTPGGGWSKHRSR